MAAAAVQFRHLTWAFDKAVDEEERDHALHLIFQHLLGEADYSLNYLSVAATLFRLYYISGWDAARTFFYLYTGKFLDFHDEIDEDDYSIETVDPHTGAKYTLDVTTIMATCMNQCPPGLMALYYADEDDGDSEFDAEEDLETESESESEADTDTEADTGTETDEMTESDDDPEWTGSKAKAKAAFLTAAAMCAAARTGGGGCEAGECDGGACASAPE